MSSKLYDILNKIVPSDSNHYVEQKVKLWENASPSSAFAAQNISIPSSSTYEALEVLCAGATTYIRCQKYGAGDAKALETSVSSSEAIYIGRRQFNWVFASNILQVGAANYKYCDWSATTPVATNNSLCTPKIVYGIKKLGG